MKTEKIGEAGKAGETGKIGKTVEIGKNRLRAMCDGLSPKKRFVVVISSLIVFAMMAVYMAISSIYFLQRPELDIEHIEGLKLPRANNDSINILKFSNHDQYDEY
jgi:hypothetical protein